LFILVDRLIFILSVCQVWRYFQRSFHCSYEQFFTSSRFKWPDTVIVDSGPWRGDAGMLRSSQVALLSSQWTAVAWWW